MHRTGQPQHSQSPCSSSSPPPHPKVILQREYRGKESECFNALRGIIKHLTGEELRTRQEILRKAIVLLFTVSENMKQSESGAQATGSLTPSETHTSADRGDVGSVHQGYLNQSVLSLQTWQSNDVAVPYYDDPQFCDQQYHFMPDTDTAFGHAGAPEYGEGWFEY